MPTFIMGDTHGKLKALYAAITDGTLPRGSDLIVLGDCGLMRDEFTPPYHAVNAEAAQRDIRIYLFRGNHDKPAFFKPENSLSNVLLLTDLAEVKYNGKKGLIFPGALSVDRYARKLLGYALFESEELSPAVDTLNLGKYDFILSHGGICPPSLRGSAPGTPIHEWLIHDPALADDLRREQDNYNRLLTLTGAARMIYGHYHVHVNFPLFNEDGRHYCTCSVLDIDEIRPLDV